jgi:hypothetical protein
MRRLPLQLAIAGLTFVVGTIISSSYQALTTPDSPPVVESHENAITYISVGPQPVLEIHAQSHACGPTANFHTYVASDGAQLSQSCLQMSSARRAAQELEKRVANATEIIERRREIQEHTPSVVWERVVIANSDGVASYSISGKSFCEATAPSLKHLQALEGR